MNYFCSCVELAEIFFVDTTPFVRDYFTVSEGHTYDWREVYPPKTYINTMLKV
jgi:tartrate-resistant acid phosphatase type 5